MQVMVLLVILLVLHHLRATAAVTEQILHLLAVAAEVEHQQMEPTVMHQEQLQGTVATVLHQPLQGLQ